MSWMFAAIIGCGIAALAVWAIEPMVVAWLPRMSKQTYLANAVMAGMLTVFVILIGQPPDIDLFKIATFKASVFVAIAMASAVVLTWLKRRRR